MSRKVEDEKKGSKEKMQQNQVHLRENNCSRKKYNRKLQSKKKKHYESKFLKMFSLGERKEMRQCPFLL